MAKYLLKTEGLTRDYGEGAGAINIDLEVKPGEIVGFIGPNGAGKTTAMSMIMGTIKRDSGRVELLGKEVKTSREYRDVFYNLGYLPADVNYYSNFTPSMIFKYAGDLLGKNLVSRGNKLAKELELDVNKEFSELSSGNKKKVATIVSLLHKPKLVIMDEPTAGLDPLMQQRVLDMAENVKKGGGSVFLSSHQLAEVEQICDRIVMIKDAKIILKEKTQDVLDRALKIFKLRGMKKSMIKEIKAMKSVKNVKELGSDLHIYVEDQEPMIKYLTKNGVYNFLLERSTLEEMFLEEYS